MALGACSALFFARSATISWRRRNACRRVSGARCFLRSDSIFLTRSLPCCRSFRCGESWWSEPDLNRLALLACWALRRLPDRTNEKAARLREEELGGLFVLAGLSQRGALRDEVVDFRFQIAVASVAEPDAFWKPSGALQLPSVRVAEVDALLVAQLLR